MTTISSTSAPSRLGDRYLLLLASVLLGYALLGKGFAYLGLPPFFIGEIALVAGTVILLRSGCLVASLASLPGLFLAAAMAWVLARTLPFIGSHGFEALRDSVVVMYGGFAFVVVALLLEDPRRLDTIVRYYGIFLTIYVPAVPFVFVIGKYMTDAIPRWPGVNVPVLLVQPTEVAVHLAGAAVFVLVGFRKAPTVAIVGAAVALGMVFAASRGGMLAFVVPVVIAALVLRRIRELMMAAALGLAIFIAAPALDAISDGGAAGTKREVSARQVVANLESLTGYSEEKLEGTKTWRLEWWNIILRHTVFGPNFWTGRGFGLNLADADGFQHRGDPKSPPLRSPHNVHMTVLARAGVPGATLWLLFLMSWGGTITNAMLAARRRGQATWAGLFLWIGCYALAAIINASFDVALEGPVQGVWFWCLMGFGMGAVMLYRCQGSLPSDWRLQRGAT